MKVATILGTRPEIIRLSRVIERLDEAAEHILVHTGQNYDNGLSDIFFEQLGVRAPDHRLHVDGASFGARVGQIIERASYGVTLRPGEVIGSGTVGTGCYMELNLTTQKDNPVWIKPGDEFVLEVDELGRLENTIRKENP